MKKFLFTLLMTITVTGLYAQCTTCNSFTEALKNPDQVTAIKINSTQHGIELTEIPADISKFKNLKTLWLSTHTIKQINEEVCKLEKLQSFSLAENELTQIPECIYEMKSLKEIILVNNKFSEKEKLDIKMRFAKVNPAVKVLFDF